MIKVLLLISLLLLGAKAFMTTPAGVALTPRPSVRLWGTPLEHKLDGVVGSVEEVLDAAEGINSYAFEIEVPGERTDRVWRNVGKELKKNANFPGFRKGQIPPYAMAETWNFTIQECINESVLQAMAAHGLVKADEKEAEADIKEKFEDIKKVFKAGKESRAWSLRNKLSELIILQQHVCSSFSQANPSPSTALSKQRRSLKERGNPQRPLLMRQ
ncbi:unnamed protein product [Chrysoparadoxa australica]